MLVIVKYIFILKAYIISMGCFHFLTMPLAIHSEMFITARYVILNYYPVNTYLLQSSYKRDFHSVLTSPEIHSGPYHRTTSGVSLVYMSVVYNFHYFAHLSHDSKALTRRSHGAHTHQRQACRRGDSSCGDPLPTGRLHSALLS